MFRETGTASGERRNPHEFRQKWTEQLKKHIGVARLWARRQSLGLQNACKDIRVFIATHLSKGAGNEKFAFWDLDTT